MSGQSNAEAREYSDSDTTAINNSIGAYSNYGKYSRTYGFFLQHNNFGWMVSTANLGWGLGGVGIVALEIQYKIAQNYGIPVCIINNAIGGTKIQSHFLNSGSPYYYKNSCNVNNIEAISGHIMRRLVEAQLLNNLKGFIWYQGESDATTYYNDYKANFKTLYDGLKANIPSLNNCKTYVCQIHSNPNSFSNNDWCRASEDQRTLPSYISYANIRLISSNGSHYPDCKGIHFTIDGWKEIGDNILNRIKTDVYGVSPNTNLTPVDIVSAQAYTSTNKLTLTFNQNIYITSPDIYANVISSIKLSNNATISNPVVSGTTLTMDLSSITGLTWVSYLGKLSSNCSNTCTPGCNCHADCNNSCHVDSRGWWCPAYIRNINGLSCLSFYQFPVNIIQGLKKNSESMTFAEFIEKINGQGDPILKYNVYDIFGRLLHQCKKTEELIEFKNKNSLKNRILIIESLSKAELFSTKIIN